ncbi:unnamed protein product (macronuclear) [Paramecium tetraurelia]|uniref:Uncharacterized protein n=1 Tax=Paramecium tetraurelia TaxID=5888 RepID=A0DM20_PARTE|nr:uncharacterized protein GSPATT00018305001 [Paramecium tetraurelia]CAK84087.1 unnamed protein product [Paramecium tetraurelia]|eukprot:XP_001451484.1 hypothetical protein (macronuclear) [Paramecium tetraurelia strain d4-2]
MTQSYFQNALKYVQTLQEQNQISKEEKSILKMIIVNQDVSEKMLDKREAVTQVSQKLKTLRRIRRIYLQTSQSLNQITEKSMEIDF